MLQLLLSCSLSAPHNPRHPGVIVTVDKASSENSGLGLLWWSSAWDCMLPMQEAQVQSLVGELRSHMPCCVAKKKKKEERKSKLIFYSSNSFSSQQQGLQRENVGNSVSRNSGCLFLLSVTYHGGLVPRQCLGLQSWHFAYDDITVECTTSPPGDFGSRPEGQMEGPKCQEALPQCPASSQETSQTPPLPHCQPAQLPFLIPLPTPNISVLPHSAWESETCLFHSLDVETWPSCASLSFWRNQLGRWTTMVFPY